MERSGGGGMILVGSGAVLLRGVTSPPPATVAVLLATPSGELLATLTVRIMSEYLAPGARVSLRVQVTVAVTWVQLQPMPLAAFAGSVSPVGRGSVTVTGALGSPVRAGRPALVTVMV